MALDFRFESMEKVPDYLKSHVAPVKGQDGTEVLELQFNEDPAAGLKRNNSALKTEKSEIQLKLSESQQRENELRAENSRLASEAPAQLQTAQREVELRGQELKFAQDEILRLNAEREVSLAVAQANLHPLATHELMKQVRGRRLESGGVAVEVLDGNGQPRMKYAGDSASPFTATDLVQESLKIDYFKDLVKGHKPAPGSPPGNGDGLQNGHNQNQHDPVAVADAAYDALMG